MLSTQQEQALLVPPVLVDRSQAVEVAVSRGEELVTRADQVRFRRAQPTGIVTVPGVKYYTGRERQQEEKGEQVHVVRLFGDDAEMLEKTAEALEGLFTRLPGVLGLKSAEDPRPPASLAS